jgi:hypothetical protein
VVDMKGNLKETNNNQGLANNKGKNNDNEPPNRI